MAQTGASMRVRYPKKTANKKIGWGFIGASTIAREYIAGAVHRTGGDLLWVMSHDAGHAENFARDCDIPNHTSDLNVLLADDRVDVVYVSSINSSHCAQVLRAAQAGKHILCDKPLATRPTDAIRMISACEKHNVVLAVNHHLRSSPIHQAMQRMIAEGEIGQVLSLQIVNASFLRPALQSWRIRDPAEGGIYLDLSVHDIDLSCFLLQQSPVRAVAIGQSVSFVDHSIHDHTMYVMEMSSGTLVQVNESFVSQNVESQIIAVGTKGSIVASGTLAQKSGGTLIVRFAGTNTSVPLRSNDIYADTVDQFLLAIGGKGVPRASGQDGLVSLLGAEAVARAARTGRSAKVRMTPPQHDVLKSVS
jgi:1,5-anhydro-D-fructose reductase (1,5-anhydro-D-mannitol-forming)